MSDQAIRARLLKTDESFCVTAPAGSGKTSVLTQRILSLLAKVDKPEQVLAITFTRKAAAEMKSRVLEALVAAKQHKKATSEHEQLTIDLAKRAIEHSHQTGREIHAESLNIKTIDGLCGYLSRGMPLLSGLGGSVGLVEDASPLYREAVEGLYAQLPADNDYADSLRALLLSFDNDWQRLSELLLDLLSRRADWLRELGQHISPQQSETAIRSNIAGNIESRLAIAAQSISTPQLELVKTLAIRAAMRIAATYAEGANSSRTIPLCPEGDFSLAPTTDCLKYWQWLCRLILKGDDDVRARLTVSEGFGPDAKEDKEELSAFLSLVAQNSVLHDIFVEIRALPLLENSLDDWQGVLHLSRVLPLLSAQLLTVFQKYGQVDYAHIAIAAEDALGPDDMPTDLALRLDYQISHILVDEFQDTSLSQFRLLTRLCRGWQEHNSDPKQSKRTLFLVGDAMQSIYGFRHANVSLFVRAATDGVAGIPLTSLALTMNFRSQAGLVSWVNTHFEPLLPEAADLRLGAVPQTKAEAHHETSREPAVQIHVYPDDRMREAEATAIRILELRKSEPDSSIAVLGRSRPALQPTVQALLAEGLEINGSDLTALEKRPVINDLLSLCRYLANPADRVAYSALLRSPLCGMTAADIEIMSRIERSQSEVFDPSPVDLIGDELSPDGSMRLKHLRAGLQWAESKRDRLDLAVWIELTWLKLGGALASNEADLSDAEAFLSKLRSFEKAGQGFDIEGLSRWAADSFSSSEKGQDAIEVMTLHKSKGLEFDHVFIVGCGQRDRSSDRALLHWHRDPENGFLIAARPEDNQSEGLYNYLHWMQKTREGYEAIRLYYVGVTRAKVSCCLSGTRPSTSVWPPKPGNNIFGRLCEVASISCHYHDPIIADNEGSSQKKRPLTLSRLTSNSINRLNLAQGYPSTQGPPAESVLHDLTFADNLEARRFGTVLHRGLELLAERSELPERCPDAIIHAMRFGLTQLSSSQSVTADQLDSLEQDLNRVLSVPETRWALEGHLDAHNEFELWLENEQRQVIIDRTFIDASSGIRWVIDYKTSSPTIGQDNSAFLQDQTERYRAQLQQYGDAIRSWDLQLGQAREVKAALLFSRAAQVHEVHL